MAPKPFNPPRPTAGTSSSTAKKPGRPKGSTSTSKVTKPKSKSNASMKPPKEKGKEKRISDSKRTSIASVNRLHRLSPDTAEEDEAESGSDVEMASRPQSRTAEEAEDAEDSDPFATPPAASKSKPKPAQEAVPQRRAHIPHVLLSVLVHEMFKHKAEGGDKGTRMGKEAVRATGKYIDTFVREAVARAAWEGEGRGDGGSGVLEVEDLERLAPQLVLDF